MNAVQLPTFQGGQFAFTAFRESLLATLDSDNDCQRLSLLFYAVTDLGWSELRGSVDGWVKRQTGRTAVAYIGTDHGITDPQALQQMSADGIDVRLLMRYAGIYHPKVVWLSGTRQHLVWVGSNNLTREGLRNNIECATLVKSDHAHPDFLKWVRAIDLAATALSDDLLKGYQRERDTYGASRGTTGTFTWSKKQEPVVPPTPAPAPGSSVSPAAVQPAGILALPGDLIMEVMPRETGQSGKQVQLPKATVTQFFGLPDRVGVSRQIHLSYQGGLNPRTLTMSIFGNVTVRLVLNELDYRNRPCVLVFHKTATNRFEYEIVQRSIEPVRYRELLAQCNRRTRTGSRRWCIA